MEILNILYALPQAVSHYKYSKFLLFGKQLFYFSLDGVLLFYFSHDFCIAPVVFLTTHPEYCSILRITDIYIRRKLLCILLPLLHTKYCHPPF